ncbi:cytochrome c oxidase, subunit VIa [Dioszegia hungarica]|uniref:Cytochrome c oxidase, subunit VIa n=1 Tax=Dioszegia hungarica TaxID=4972 RepID=A0AA38LTP0_9TREE|nr:cytochrome c oxidase, subunit VIa [Dioszegia hungarica]XP_052944787.1 cytochrome c oxidase, subunit VIa [Dioszegia hungarica]KAI9634999.1 cytochrome c oxidase, subunit VIa [Dioszegia hungarica]KAI9635010.1 cytochrome c oxidase, subunit VIa [Dioszegia hungarica]
MFRPGLALQLTRAVPRRFASTVAAGENEFVAKRAAMREHATQTTDLWKKISFFVCIPGIAVCALWTYKAEMAHKAHAAHAGNHAGGGDHGEDATDEEAEHGGRKVYSYMNIRNKPFPWGMQTLFFNPEINIPAEEQ